MAKRRAKGEGSLRKRSDGRWEGRYTAGRDPDTGKLIYRNVLARTQSECKAKLKAAIAQQGSEDMTPGDEAQTCEKPKEHYTLGSWMRLWYEVYSKPNIRMTTQEFYSNFIEKHIVPKIGDTPIEKVTSLQLQKFYNSLQTNGKVRQQPDGKQGLSKKVVRGIHTLLRMALTQAVQEGIISSNPTDHCTVPRLERREMRVIPPEQITAYLQAAKNYNVLPMFYLELSTGLRRGELLALLWSDLDIENQTIRVNKQVMGRHGELIVSTPKTAHSIRTIDISPQAIQLLQEEHALHPDNPYMFPSPVTGTMYHPDTAGRIHKKLLKEAGIEDVRFHDLRHTFATVALQNGVDIKTLSNVLGHFSSGFTLDTYTHVTKKMKQDAAEKVGQFLEMSL